MTSDSNTFPADSADGTAAARSERALKTLLVSDLVGSTALVNLWQRGAVWGGTANEGMLAGSWLVWSAGWLAPRQHPRIRAVLIILAALSLVAAVIK